MGLFGRKKREQSAADAAPKFEPSEEGRAYRQALLDGDNTTADRILRVWIEAGEGEDPVMSEAALARVALDRQDWDAAAEALARVEATHPTLCTENSADFIEASAAYVQQGLHLIEFLGNPATQEHPRYGELLDGPFVTIVKGVRLASRPGLHGLPPVPLRVSFDPAYAELKSSYELNKVR